MTRVSKANRALAMPMDDTAPDPSALSKKSPVPASLQPLSEAKRTRSGRRAHLQLQNCHTERHCFKMRRAIRTMLLMDIFHAFLVNNLMKFEN